MRVEFPGMPKADDAHQEKESHEETFSGTIVHSSELDDTDLQGKNVVVIGSGASGVEAIETALSKGAKHTVIVARDDKVSSEPKPYEHELSCGLPVDYSEESCCRYDYFRTAVWP
jgi:NADPH-dependent glutamate synthase beta subunit-like oxidoreductase